MRDTRASARLCLIVALALCWLNYLLTSRWAEVPGALHGAKESWFLGALVVTTVLALSGRVGGKARLGPVAIGMAALGALFLAGAFLVWFPLDDWQRIPFQDNWPARYQSTVDQISLFRRGAVVGWQWAFLGGYHLSSDLTVTLAVLGAAPMGLFGDQLGFHILHAALFAAIPLLVWLDLHFDDNPELKWVAAGLAAVLAAGYSYRLLGSGDTNSLAGVVTTMLTLFAAGLVRRSRLGGPLLVLGLSLIIYSHAGFLLFAMCYLALDVVLTRERRHAQAVAIACAAAFVVGLPLTWESLVYRDYFTPNNAVLEPPVFDGWRFVRMVYYNFELLARPDRWLNDYTGLVTVFLPVSLWVAGRGVGRPRFYAFAVLVTFVITRLYYPQQLGWGLIRAAHMHAVFAAPVLAWFIVSCCSRRALGIALFVLVSLYIQVSFSPVPHVSSIRAFDAQLLDRISSADGALVLVENSYHPEMDEDPSRLMEPTPFRVHFEALVPPATGRRLYAGVWDGWQWAPARRRLLANGAIGGRRIDLVSDAALTHELRRWGVCDLFVWSRTSIERLSASGAFGKVWQHGRWQQFRLRDADVRTVETVRGTGELRDLGPLSGTIQLRGARAGDRVVVRTNYHPAWRAVHEGSAVRLLSADGQLALRAPANGDSVVTLVYPRRLWLIVLGLVTGAAGAGYLWRLDP